MAVVGVGIDVVELERFDRAVERSATFLERVFTPAERELSRSSLAARWAAKEALAKALGAPSGLVWHVEQLGIGSLHVSLSHDAGIASAVVIAEAP